MGHPLVRCVPPGEPADRRTHPVHPYGIGATWNPGRRAGHDDDEVAGLAPAEIQQRLVDLFDHLVGVVHRRRDEGFR